MPVYQYLDLTGISVKPKHDIVFPSHLIDFPIYHIYRLRLTSVSRVSPTLYLPQDQIVLKFLRLTSVSHTLFTTGPNCTEISQIELYTL